MTFWLLRDTGRNLAEWDRDVHLSQHRCPVFEEHKGPGKRLNDLSVRLGGKMVRDFVWTWYSECLIQRQVLDLFRDHGITGFAVKQVKSRFRRKADGSPPPLWELVVTGWGGVAPAESGIKLDPARSCSACGSLRYTGLTNPEWLIDEGHWDGSDFFMVWPLPRFILVTDTVAAVIKEAQFKGAELIDVAKMEKTSGYGPGRLSYWMPEARARMLGEPLGIF